MDSPKYFSIFILSWIEWLMAEIILISVLWISTKMFLRRFFFKCSIFITFARKQNSGDCILFRLWGGNEAEELANVVGLLVFSSDCCKIPNFYYRVAVISQNRPFSDSIFLFTPDTLLRFLSGILEAGGTQEILKTVLFLLYLLYQ